MSVKIVNLIENTEGITGCTALHGLSFYIETGRHRILMDLGPSEETLKNADRLGIDLKEVDTVVISHGHYDHTGGLLPFAERNPYASIYLQRSAAGEYFSEDGPETMRYIGMAREALSLSRIRWTDGDYRIDDQLQLITTENRKYPIPFSNGKIREKQGDAYLPDRFLHEQSLIITDNGRRILLSGCAHNGILNILEEFRRKTGADPDAVISGFHLMKKTDYSNEEIETIADTAKALKQYRTRFYTCHCTGLPAYDIMKTLMGEQLDYVHSGDTLCFCFPDGETASETESYIHGSGARRTAENSGRTMK